MISLRSNSIRRCCAFFSLILLLFTAVSCSNLLGYGVLLWSVPEEGLSAGDVVPVYIKSNISQVYVIGIPETDRKMELPLWQLNVAKSKKDADALSQKMEGYANTYARVALDGLPVRYEPDNTARQVYRLRQDEIIKVLKKGKGSPVMAGSKPMEGDWLQVLTEDGTTGWCFSYNLRLFDERDAGKEQAPAAVAADPALEGLMGRTWYPESYKTMMDRKQVDPESINLAWGFDPGAGTGIVRITTPSARVSSPYTAITKTADNSWKFEGTTVSMQLRRSDYLIVQYADEKGMPRALNFVSLSVTPQEIVDGEMERRSIEYGSIRSMGPSFVSSNYGLLQFLEGNQFLWSGYSLLSPDVIPVSAGNKGSVELRLFPDRSLLSLYDGVLSFKFDNTSKYINFLYKIDDTGLRLENVSDTNVNGTVVSKRNSNPLILFFAPAGGGGL